MADASTENPALEFVKLCLSARWDAGALEAARSLAAQDGFDWGQLCRVAHTEGVAPLLYHTVRLQGLLPATVEGALRQAYYRNAGRNLILLHRLEIVLRQLDAEDVPVIVLKGAALAHGVYSKAGLRPMCDLDLLVRREDLPLTRRVLSRLGYEAPGAEWRVGFINPYLHEVTLAHPGEAATALDLHWSLFGGLDYYRIPMDWFWQTALPTRVGDAPAQVLGPAAQVLHLCEHILRHCRQGHLTLLQSYDVAAVLACYGEQVDWDQLLLKAQTYCLVLAVQQALSRLQQEWHVLLPGAVLARLGALRPSRDEEHPFIGISVADRPALGFWSGLLSISDWRVRLGFARSVLLPPADYMQWRYRIPHRWLLPLYYPYRWLHSLRSRGKP
jgi:hypothetical protein